MGTILSTAHCELHRVRLGCAVCAIAICTSLLGRSYVGATQPSYIEGGTYGSASSYCHRSRQAHSPRYLSLRASVRHLIESVPPPSTSSSTAAATACSFRARMQSTDGPNAMTAARDAAVHVYIPFWIVFRAHCMWAVPVPCSSGSAAAVDVDRSSWYFRIYPLKVITRLSNIPRRHLELKYYSYLTSLP